MSIPWTDEITITPRAGAGAYGSTYGTATTAKARVEQVQKRVTNTQGAEVIANLMAFVHPTATIAAGDKVTWNSGNYDVVSAAPMRHWTATHHIEVYLISRPT